MSKRSIPLNVAAKVVIAVIAAQPAVAQSPQGQAPQAQPLGGTLVQGVCLLSREAVFANAAVGKAATARLQQLAQVAQAEVDGDRKPLEADIKTFQAEGAKLDATQRQLREQALTARLQPIQSKADLRGREIEATRVKAFQRIADEAQPVIATVYKQKGCGLLLDRTVALGGNFGNDLTADVVKSLDARISTIAFDREILPAGPAVAAR